MARKFNVPGGNGNSAARVSPNRSQAPVNKLEGTPLGKLLDEKVPRIKSMMVRHKWLLISIGVSALLLLIGIGIINTSLNSVAAKEREMYNVSNQIDQVHKGSQEEEVIIRHIDHGLNTERWQRDEKLLLAFLTPGFRWYNSEDYNRNREFYVQQLGEDDPFVTEFMPPYTAKYIPQKKETDEIDDGTHIACRIAETNGFRTYVTSVNEDTGVYTYVILLNYMAGISEVYKDLYKGKMPMGGYMWTTGDGFVKGGIIATCSVDAEGAISDFEFFELG